MNLYGVVDTGLAYTYKNTEFAALDADRTNGGESQFGMQSSYNSGSRFGLKGTEDLGNGLRIGFKLENGFSSDDGNFKYENRLFGREASLSLMSEFGTFSFGRMGGVASAAGTYDVVYAIADSFDDGGDNDVFGMHSSSRYDNMVTCQSPKFAGVQATAQYSFKQNSVSGSGNEGTSKVDRYAGLAVTGEYGPLQMVGAYELTKYANTKDAHDETHAFYLGGNYDLQVMKLFALAQYTKADKNFGTLENPLSIFTGVQGVEKGIDSYGLHLGTVVPVAGGDFTAAVYYVDGETDTLRKTKQGSLDMTYLGLSARYAYPLGKRTSVYMGAGYAEEKIDVKVDDAGTNSFKNKIGQAYAGITHTF